MLEKDFAPYEPSLALKELGFDEPCFAFYNGKFIQSTEFDFDSYNSIDVGHHPLAPTFSQAFRWLLKNHNLYGIIIPTITMNWTFKTMTVVEDMMEVPPYKYVDANDYKTPEEAELACLIELIEIAKENKQ